MEKSGTRLGRGKATASEAPDVANKGAHASLGVLAIAIVREWRRASHGVLVVTDSERRAERLASVIYALDPASGALVLPRWDRLPYEHAPPSREVQGRRASVLRRLAAHEGRPLLLTTPDAILQRLPPCTVWTGATIALRSGDAVDPDALAERLHTLSYADVPEVDEPGEAAFNGRVIDVFPAGALGPVRIEFEDDRIAAISSYDVATQRTTGALERVVLDAASELVGQRSQPSDEEGVRPDTNEASMLGHYESTVTIFDYMPQAARILDGDLDARAEAWLAHVAAAKGSAPAPSAKAPPASQATFYLSSTEWRTALAETSGAAPSASLLPKTSSVPTFALDRDPRRSFARFLASQAKDGRRILLVAAHPDDLAVMERAAKLAKLRSMRAGTWSEAAALKDQSCVSVLADLDEGFGLPDESLCVVAAADLLGSRARHATPFDARAAIATEDMMLRFGDAVLHLEHGIGLLRGLETISAPDQPDQDVARIEYAGEADVLTPVGELGMVWRYSGEPGAITLDKLNGESWRKRRRDVETDIAATAKSLIELADARTTRNAPVLKPPAAEYERFVSGFPFTETPDQANAVEDILGDLASGRPMDRLVCGDVGFGKTEVALRAAAAAVLSGRQVAMVAPTTVLVRQHADTFTKRFASLGIEVAQLSRLAKPAEAGKVHDGLKSGTIRIVIGTHALAARGVSFADLGLVIIDEEQRFGTRDKENVRGLARDCHLLVTTATPIPRTLMAARVGLQSLSILATPPARRVPVRTTLTPLTDTVLRDAILQERQRNGQAFVVCPRVEDIPALSERLRSVLPDVRVLVVHGQLPPDDVDNAMMRFASGEGDVLLATNIIESGLDVPRANTILIVRPDRFGLAQLHQLRGRVGRGARRGKAFLLTTGEVAKSARKRLETFQRLEGVGVGFEISAQDMDQRGAGDLLGEEQAGHLKLLGADLHRHLLERAILQARGEETPDDWVPQINVAEAGRLPPDYVADPELRLNLYARLARLRSDEAVATFREELDDRFGSLPAEAEALLHRVLLEQRCRSAGIMRVDVGPRGSALSFLTQAHRPNALPPAAEWKGERLFLPSPSEEAGGITTVSEAIERLLGV